MKAGPLGRLFCVFLKLPSLRLVKALLEARGEAEGNPSEGCAWTGDLHGVWQLHQDERLQALVQQVNDQVWSSLNSIGFARSQVALHLQRCWPVISDWDQAVGRHHHPNAHLSAVLYLTGTGSGEEGALRLHASHQPNELVAGLAVGYGGPIASDHPLNQSLGSSSTTWFAPAFPFESSSQCFSECRPG